MSDFQKWSVLAFRAMDDAGRVLMTIEPESTTEGERLDQLKETIRELLTQVLLLNGVWTRRQLDERFQFGKLDTDALNVQLGQQHAEQVQRWGIKVADALDSAQFYRRRVEALQSWQSKMRDPERTIVCDILANGHALDPAGDRYTAPPQRKPLTGEEIAEVYMSNTDRPMQAYLEFARAIEAAHNIQEAKS